MYRRILAVALLLAGFWCLGQQEGRSQLIGEGVWKKPGSACAGFTIDGAATSQPTTGGTTTTQTLTVGSANEIIFSIITTNASLVTSTADNSGVTSAWTTARATAGSGGNNIYESWTTASAAFSGKTITTTFGTNTSFVETIVFGVRGGHLAAPFDSGGASNVPQTNTATPVSITTNNANDLLLGFFRNAGTAGPQATWTQIAASAGFTLAQFKSVSAAGVVSVSDPGLGTNGAIGDALVCGP